MFRKKVHHVQYILKEIPVYNRELFRAVLFLCSSLLAHNSLNEISYGRCCYGVDLRVRRLSRPLVSTTLRGS